MPSPRTWNVQGFLNHFEAIHRTEDRRFAFILGAGASLQSGIPMAGQLVDRWLRELHAREDLEMRPLAEWATAENLGIDDFVYARAVERYSQVFARRFEDQEDEGHADLEQVMHAKEPSFGYSVLAQILAETRHRVVITTNFDNLVADALAIYTDKLPFVCGHESLAGFVRPNPRRPLVIKIHRDLLLGPKNRSDEIAALPGALVVSLRDLFRVFTPIVIGYGGNDGSLMGLLGETLQPGDIRGGIYWCYWRGGGAPGEAITRVVARHGGALFPIDGFDELMLQLGHRLRLPLMDQRIEERARERAKHYRESVETLQRRVYPPPEPPADEAATPEPDGVPFAAPSTSPPAASPPLAPSSSPAPPLARDPEPGDPRGPLRSAASDRSSGRSEERGPRRSAASAEANVRDASPPKRAPPGPSLLRAEAPLEPDLSDRLAPRDDTRHELPALDDTAPETIQLADDLSLPLQQAVHALASASPAASDWWTLKLQADRLPGALERIAAYREILLRFPDQPELIRGLALELAMTPQRAEGRELYRRLERTTPDDPQLYLDLSVLYVHWGVGRTQAEPHAARAWRLAQARPRDSAMLAAIAFVRGLWARRENRADTTPLRVLRALLPVSAGPLVPLAGVLSRFIRKLDEPSQQLYFRLLTHLRGSADVDTLQAIARWTKLTPLAPEDAWTEDAPVPEDILHTEP